MEKEVRYVSDPKNKGQFTEKFDKNHEKIKMILLSIRSFS